MSARRRFVHVFATFGPGGPQVRAAQLMRHLGPDVEHVIQAVDGVTDICRVPEGELPLRGQIDPAWTPYARAIVEHEGHPWLLVSLAAFIEGGALAQAA